jgi:hypothetical protein
MKQVKGWRRFKIVDAWAQPVRLAAASRKGVKKGTVASTDPRVKAHRR